MQANPPRNCALDLPSLSGQGQSACALHTGEAASIAWTVSPVTDVGTGAERWLGKDDDHSTGYHEESTPGKGRSRGQKSRAVEHQPVLVFQGGGYDGCIYEWNAIIFKRGTPIRPALVQPCISGRAGKRVLDAAQNGLRAAVAAARNEGDWHLCTTPASWVKFDADFNKGFVRLVCKAARRECRCDRCKKWFDPDEIVHTGYRGNGGIGVQFDDNHCLECAEEEHDAYCAKSLWKYESIGTRVEAIQRHNEESVHQVSIFAARRTEAPVGYHFYAGEPDYY